MTMPMAFRLTVVALKVEMKNIIIRNTKVICKGGALNAGIFFADHAGADLTLDSVYVDGGASPNGAIWLANARGDAGCKSLIARHVRVKSDGVYGQRGFRLDPTPSLAISLSGRMSAGMMARQLRDPPKLYKLIFDLIMWTASPQWHHSAKV